jgi:hypothetical protein
VGTLADHGGAPRMISGKEEARGCWTAGWREARAAPTWLGRHAHLQQRHQHPAQLDDLGIVLRLLLGARARLLDGSREARLQLLQQRGQRRLLLRHRCLVTGGSSIGARGMLRHQVGAIRGMRRLRFIAMGFSAGITTAVQARFLSRLLCGAGAMPRSSENPTGAI